MSLPRDSLSPDTPAEENGADLRLAPEELEHLRALSIESEEEAEEIERGRTHWLRYVVILVILGAGVSVLFSQAGRGDLRKFVHVVRSMHPWAIALALVVETMSYVALGYMMRRIVLLTGQKLKLGRAVLVTLAAGSVGLVAGGLVGIGGSSYRWLKDDGIRTEGAVLAGWLPSLLSAAMVATSAVVGVGYLMVMKRLTPALWVAFVFSLLVVVGAVGLAWWGSSHHAAAERVAVRVQARWARLRRKPEKPEQVVTTVEGLYDAMGLLKRRGWKGPALGAALGVALDATCMYLVFVAARHPVSIGVLLAGYGIPLLVGKVGVIPGGVGLVEAMMYGIFTGVGVPAVTAGSVVLGFRVMAFWFPNLAGFAIMPLLSASRRPPPQRVPAPARGRPPGR